MLCNHESSKLEYEIFLVMLTSKSCALTRITKLFTVVDILHVMIIIALRSGNADTKLLKLNYLFIRKSFPHVFFRCRHHQSSC